MWLLFPLLALTAATMHMYAGVDQTKSDLAQYFCDQKDAFATLLATEPTIQEDIAALKSFEAQIVALEDKHGITKIQQRLADMRLESCHIQHTTPGIKKLLDTMKALTTTITTKTKSQQAQLDNLIARSMNETAPASNNPTDAKIMDLQAAIQRTAQPELTQIESLNRQIYTLMRRELNAAKPLMRQIKQNYTTIKPEITELNDQIAQLVERINQKMAHKATELTKRRETIWKLKEQLINEDPCYFARTSKRRAEWIDLFI